MRPRNVVIFYAWETCYKKPPSQAHISGWSQRHQRPRTSGCSSERRAINSWVSRTHHYLNNVQFLARRSEEQSMPRVAQNAATTPAKNRLEQPSAWQTPSNCRHFLDNLYQIQFSDCSALSETRLQSLPHPYSPLRASAFFRISRNPGPGKVSISQKSFGMNISRFTECANWPQPGFEWSSRIGTMHPRYCNGYDTQQPPPSLPSIARYTIV